MKETSFETRTFIYLPATESQPVAPRIVIDGDLNGKHEIHLLVPNPDAECGSQAFFQERIGQTAMNTLIGQGRGRLQGRLLPSYKIWERTLKIKMKEDEQRRAKSKAQAFDITFIGLSGIGGHIDGTYLEIQSPGGYCGEPEAQAVKRNEELLRKELNLNGGHMPYCRESFEDLLRDWMSPSNFPWRYSKAH